MLISLEEPMLNLAGIQMIQCQATQLLQDVQTLQQLIGQQVSIM